MSGPRAPSVGLSALLLPLAFGCGTPSTERLDWTVEWSDPSTEDATAAVRYRLLAGRCSGDTTLEHTSGWVQRDTDPATLSPVTLEPGDHCICVEAQDAECRRIAEVCETVELPRSEPLTVTLEAIAPEPMMCDCHSASCGDAGAADAGPPEGVDYVVPRATDAPTIDGSCDDFAASEALPLLGVDTSDNTTECRFQYAAGSGGGDRAVIFACCVVEDDDIQADESRTRDDAGAWQDDRVEMWVRPGPEVVFDEDYVKIALTAAGTVVDSAYDPVELDLDSSYFTVVEHREVVDGTLASDGAADVSYTLEYRAELPESAEVAPGDLGRMNVFMADHDAAGTTLTMAAGGSGTINDPGVALRVWFAP